MEATTRLERAQIEVEYVPPERQQIIEACFNPTQYSLERSARVAQVETFGINKPIPQHVNGGPRILTMDLLFDTYGVEGPGGAPVPVTDVTDRIYALLDIPKGWQRPRYCTFVWGRFRLQCLLERVGGRFTLFTPEGVPVRATLNVVFREFHPEDDQLRVDSSSGGNFVSLYTVRAGDTLPGVAAQQRRDPADWRRIAEANDIDDPLRLTPGQSLTLPSYY